MENSNLKIRRATLADTDRLMEIFEVARNFMKVTGNPNQWINGYPERKLVEDGICSGHCYVMEQENRHTVVATFCYIKEPDPNYTVIEGGEWLNDEPYAVIHRLASDGTCHGVFDACLAWSEARCSNLRVDTHTDNRVMQQLLMKVGFQRCGIIYVANGTPRIAFQRVVDSHLGETFLNKD